MRRGFTLIELMMASTISIFVMAAMMVVMMSIWQLMKSSSDELQLALHARNVRERLLVRVDATHDGLLGINANVEGRPSESTGFNVWIAQSERLADGSVVSNRFVVPADFSYLKGTRATDVGLSGHVVDQVKYREFLPTEKIPVTGAGYEPRLLRLNIYHHPTGDKGTILEDHPVFFMENGVW